MRIRNLFALLCVSAFTMTSCNNERGVSNGTENTEPQDVLVSLNLGDNLRAAMSDAQGVTKAGAATVENVDVYLTSADGTIKTSKRFAKGTQDFTKLTSAEAIGNTTKGGYKFTNVDATVTRASVVVNPQDAAILNTPENVNTLKANIKAKAGDAIYSELNKSIEALGVEPIEPDPDTNSKANVKKVEFVLKGDMSRFQVATKFSVVKFKEGKKDEFIAWKKKYVEQNSGSDRTYDAKDQAYIQAVKAKFGDFKEGNPDATWNQTWKVVDVTAKNRGVFMNDFDYTLDLSSKSLSGRLLTTTYAGAYTTANGTLTLNSKDVSDVASYFSAAGFTTKFEGSDAKVLAFNFFEKQAAGKNLKEKVGAAPRLHFYFATAEGLDADHQFVNIVKYDLGKTTFAGAQLLNIDMNKINNGNGIIVQSDDPAVPEHGKPDVDNKEFNLIVRVSVAQWTEVNVMPIAE